MLCRRKLIGPHASTAHRRKAGVQPGPGPRLSEIQSEPGTPFAPVERFERRKLFLGKYILGICQDHDVKGTSLVLPCTQRHAEFEVTSRDCSGMPRMIIPGFTLQHVVRFHKSTGDRPPGPRLSAAPALSNARCLVVPNGNHVHVDTLEAPPVHKSNIASVQAES